MRFLIYCPLFFLPFCGCHTAKKDSCCDSKNGAALSCKLTNKELQARKATVLVALQKQIISKKELPDGYAFEFPGNDAMIDSLTEFVKTERACCDFFTFGLTISGDKKSIWLNLTGPEGAKAFIKEEMEL